MHSVQFPLHEPYFDLTPIKVTHSKITKIKNYNLLSKNKINKQPNLLRILLSAPDEWLVPIWCCYSRFLVIPYSCSRISDYNSQIVISNFVGLAPFYNIASLCRGICGTSIAHAIKAMMTCLGPCYYFHL